MIIFYADDLTYDISRLRQLIDEGRRRIAEAAGISIGKLSVQFGGYRHTVTTEFWILPKKGAKPVPQPEERPAVAAEELETAAN